MKRNLTDAFIRSLRAPATGRLEVNDASCRGLALRITPNDVRSWSFRFTGTAGTVQRMSIGGYPAIGLADARLRADALRRDLAAGIDPVAAKRQRRLEARSGSKTFAHLANRYVLEYSRPHNRPRTAFENERNLKATVLPAWGHRNYDTITRGDIYELVNSVARRGAPILANRIRSLISKIFAFALDQELMQSSPAFRIKKPGKEKVNTRILSDNEIRAFWLGIVEAPIARPVGLALRLALLLGLRASEVGGLRRDELRDVGSKDKATIELAGERTKNGRPLCLPLSPLDHDTLAEALELSTDATYVFPNCYENGAVSNNRLALTMRQFIDASTAATSSWRVDQPTPHDLRRTCATRLASLGIDEKLIGYILNHAPAGITRRHYNVHDYADEKRMALDAW